MEHLAALGLTPETVTIQLERAAHARWRYLTLCRREKAPVDGTVDQHLMNHMMLLDSLATLGGIENGQLQAAVRRGQASGSQL